MQKKELMTRLKTFVLLGRAEWKGQKSFVQFFALWLKETELKNENWEHWHIDHYVPQLVVDAFEELRTGASELATRWREKYQQETGHGVPNLTEMGESSSLDQAGAVQITGFMLDKVMGNTWISTKLDAYANSQRHVLQLNFDKFLRTVYGKGLYDIIQKSKHRGMSGKFGDTELRTFSTAGSLKFTFARPGKMFKCSDQETSVSFVAEDDDRIALSAGIQSEYASLTEAMAMIEDVIKGWPTKKKDQAKVFTVDKDVNLGISI